MIYSLRTVYLAVLVIIVMLICLFIGSLVFFDKTNRRAYYYDIRVNDRLVATCKIDRFATEDRIIFKQASDTAFDPAFSSSKTKIVFDKKYVLESFCEERTMRSGDTTLACVEAQGSSTAFLARSRSRVTCVEDIPVRKDIFVFQDDQPVTYLPIIENYDFHKGRSQGFHALTFPAQLLPPARRYVTLTSIRDEYIKVGGRRIKAEELVLKIKNYPQGYVWVAESDRKLLMVDLPKKGIRIVRRFRPAELTAAEPPQRAPSYRVRDVLFKNKNVQLAGTLTAPEAPGRYPGVLLVSGDGPYDRDYMGVYASLADYLTANGFCTLRFDKRGAGKSSGESAWPLTADTAQDIQAAMQFLAGQPEVRPGKIAVVAHGDGALAAAQASTAAGDAIAGIVFMSPSLYEITDFDTHPELLPVAATRNLWSDDYVKLVRSASRQTRERALASKFGWAYILGRRCFMGEVKERCLSEPLAIADSIAVPVLILQGEKDRNRAVESASALDRALEAQGNRQSNLVYFKELGHFLSEMIVDGASRIHYAISRDAADTIRAWLNKTYAEPAIGPDDPAGRAAAPVNGAGENRKADTL